MKSATMDLSHELSGLIRGGVSPTDQAAVQALVAGLISTEGTTPAEALPLTKLVAELLTHFATTMAAPVGGEPDRQYLVTLCAALCVRATRTLEAATGLPADGFFGGIELRN